MGWGTKHGCEDDRETTPRARRHGAVVPRAGARFHLVAGLPAVTVGIVCRCGPPLLRVRPGEDLGDHEVLTCAACGRRYAVTHGRVKELDG